ncbi:unnamed protein product, partial [Choristocarpus tenellus]
MIQAEVKQLQERGIIRPSNSAWAAAVVAVRKKDGTLRLCTDYRMLNDLSHSDSGGLGNITSIFDELKGSSYFTAIDLASGFFQLEIVELDKHRTAFQFVGMKVGRDDLNPAPSKMIVVAKLDPPSTVEQLRSFLGMTGYMRQKKIIPWGPDEKKAFEELKVRLVSPPILLFPDWDKKFLLHTDASEEGAGATLTQVQDDDQEHVIAYAS